jgi:putative acetyltransferase
MATVRRAIPEDAVQIHDAHMRSIRDVCAPDYTDIEIDAWGNRPFNLEARLQSIQNNYVWVAEDNNVIEGFGHMSLNQDAKTAYIHAFYFTPKILGLGLGKLLLQEMIYTAKDLNLDTIHLHSTLTAQTFYESQGFSLDGDLTTVKINQTPVRCLPMSRSL